MEILMFISYFLMFLIAIILSFASIKYFITMWKFKNRKKDGSEDDEPTAQPPNLNNFNF